MTRPRKKRQQSSIDLLPDSVRRQLQELLADRRVTQLQAVDRINAILAEMQASGELPPEAPEKLSKSAVNRYAIDMDEIGQELRESREIAEVWIGKLGAMPQSDIGNLVNEILRVMSFDLSRILKRGGIEPDNAPAVVGMLKDLALTTQRLEQASTLNTKRTAEIRKQTLEEAADKIGETAKEAGVTADTIARIRRDVLRMSA